ncbi:GNAT family N-acetyltransferase [Streptomyces sp. WAC 01529]|uniref:GNAT family N-acetyltransferase n=1 Tax=Streptomyces sp. WAC 01529 TaxID=2203205 RepID=UPI000F71DF30|nr:GNAT family N-acetyltransferase [Streptomyces sp. WAC 01529]AZM53865.1 GNAT family N-acetyltransferase [Streptomyces sp. WAC 01529]
MSNDSEPRWQLTRDLGAFFGRADAFLRSEPAPHTALLTVTDTLRTSGLHAYGEEAPHFGTYAEEGGRVRGVFLRTPPHRAVLSPLTPEAADALARRLADVTPELPGVAAEQETAEAFALAWEKHAGATATPGYRQRLYRLGTLTPPEPAPPGRARVADEGDRELLTRWHREFAEAVGEPPAMDAGEWVRARLAYGGITLWETPDGTPAAMAGATRRIAGQVRVAPVYTPAGLRGRGYGGAATVAVTRAALDAGAAEVLLFTDLANPTSNGLYQRIGYRPVQDFTQYDFTPYDFSRNGFIR